MTIVIVNECCPFGFGARILDLEFHQNLSPLNSGNTGALLMTIFEALQWYKIMTKERWNDIQRSNSLSYVFSIPELAFLPLSRWIVRDGVCVDIDDTTIKQSKLRLP
jgi:hypothetical protein